MNNLAEKLLRSILFQGLQVQNLLFRDIPSEYKEQIKNISDPVIKNVFSKFVFKYFSFLSIINDNDIDSKYISFIFEFLTNFKLIIYDVHYPNSSQHIQPPNVKNQQKNKNYSDIDTEKFNLTICSESQCIIIEYIAISQIQNIVNKLKEEEISLINISSDSKIYNAIRSKEEKKTNEEKESYLHNDEMNAQEEIKNFCDEFQQEMQNIPFDMEKK